MFYIYYIKMIVFIYAQHRKIYIELLRYVYLVINKINI